MILLLERDDTARNDPVVGKPRSMGYGIEGDSQESLGQAYQLWIIGVRHRGHANTTNKPFLLVEYDSGSEVDVQYSEMYI